MAPPKQQAPKGSARARGGSGGGSNAAGGGRRAITDPRFANIQSDPRFRLPSKKKTQVQLDSRFARVLQDEDFSKKAEVDRYGRKVEEKAGKKELERFYRVADAEEEEESDESEGEDKSDVEVDDDDEVTRELERMDRKYDPARDGGFSSSSEDESESESESEEEAIEEEEDEEARKQADVPLGEVSSRIAVVNMDWDNIRAVDLMAVASSFAPPDGRILNVTVYPSEFGRERIEREEIEGPPKEVFKNSKRDEEDEEAGLAPAASEDEDDSDEEERIKKSLIEENKGEDFDSGALRAYQLERLRYYYAVITVSSKEAAKTIYDEMDGREYLSSANFFDLRFVPDDVSFDEDRPRDWCDRVPDGYKPNDFVTDALTHSKVKLTWDADDKTRQEVQKRAFSQKEMDENDLLAYIGNSESEEGSESSDEEVEPGKKSAKEAKAAALRAALGLSSEPKKDKKKEKVVGDMQITFTSGLSGAGAAAQADTSGSEDDDESDAEGRKKKKGKKSSVFVNEPEETTMEKYIRKEKERKARRKERTKALREGRDPDEAVQALEAKKKGETAAAAAATPAADVDVEAAFNDPFFDDPVAVSAAAKKEAKKAAKAQKRAEREAAAEASRQERAELELLMQEEDAEVGAAGVRHFDMKAIEQAEKAARKKGGRKTRKAKDAAEAILAQDDFRIDTEDPRFARLFASHEFAIDPTNPKFKPTKGMRALLEEGRRKRKAGVGLEEEEEGGRKRTRGVEEVEKGEDVLSLVEKVKKKVKARSTA